MNMYTRNRHQHGRRGSRLGRTRTWLIPLLAIAAGTGIGAATTLTKYQEPSLVVAGHEENGAADKGEAISSASMPDARPRVHLPGPSTYEFGVMARNEEQSHTFQVQNIGSGTLTLKVANTTCKCTVGSLGKDSLAPGETADVTLTWETLSYDREFRQNATIETNDQSQREIIFSVTGQVLQLAMPDPPLIKLARISRSEPQQFEVIVYGYRDEDLAIVDQTFSFEDTAKFFSIKTEPLPKELWNTTAAKSAIRVTVDIAPGLPLGVVRQLINLETNKPDIAPMDVAIDMTVVSDISVLGGREFNDETNLLSLGLVTRSQGRVVPLNLMVKGPHVGDVAFSVAEIIPADALQIEIGEAIDINQGSVRRFPCKIIVPPNCPTVYHMGNTQGSLGQIVLNTSHPEIDKLTIRVQFAVQ